MDYLLDDEKLSSVLDVSVGTLANWRYQGRGPRFVKVGRHVRYRRSDVEDWLERNARESTAAAAP